MLEKQFHELYLMFRANYYRQLVKVIGAREGSLSATESYCVELIYLMQNPTVSDFAGFLGISVPNATYKISNLIAKGYVIQRVSDTDKRERRLEVTEKFLNYYGLNDSLISNLMKAVRKEFSESEVDSFEEMLGRVVILMKKSESEDSEGAL